MERVEIKSRFFADIWYAVHRAGYSFPYPVLDNRSLADAEWRNVKLEQQLRDGGFAVLRRQLLFESLTDAKSEIVWCTILFYPLVIMR